MIYPFGINLLPGLFRIPSLSNKNKKSLYIFSKIVQLIEWSIILIIITNYLLFLFILMKELNKSELNFIFFLY